MFLGDSFPRRYYVGGKSSERQFSLGVISRGIFVKYYLGNCLEQQGQSNRQPVKSKNFHVVSLNNPNKQDIKTSK